MSQRRPLVPVDPDEWQEDYVPRLSRRQQLADGALVLSGVLVLTVVVIIGSAFFFRWLDEMEAGSGWVEIGRIQVGQCFDRDPTAPDDGVMPSVRIADCAAEHDGELIGRFEWDGPKDDNILDYPGLDTLFDYAGPRCDELARDYIGPRYEDAFAEFVMTPLVPLRSAWMQEAAGGRVFEMHRRGCRQGEAGRQRARLAAVSSPHGGRMCYSPHMRMHIEMERELVERLDAVAGERGRSQFVRRAVEAALEQHERTEKILAAGGLLRTTEHEWDADPAGWVHHQRRADSRRVG